jgi:hypothetical protein
MYSPTFITISAKQGDPSILWIGQSGRYYRNKEAAIKDNAKDAYPYKKPVSTVVWVGILTLCVVALGIFIYIKKRK